MNPWPFILAAHAVAILGTLAVTLSSYRAMRRAEKDSDALGNRP